MAFPLTLSVDTPEEMARWRPLAQWFLAIPPVIVSGVLTYVAGALAFISFFTILFTKQMPDGIYRFQVMSLRYTLRASSYAGFLHDSYPPYEFDAVIEDPGGSPATFSFAEQPPEMRRFLPLVKWLLAIPHYIVLWVLGIGAFLAYIVAFFVVLFTGAWPTGIQEFIVGVLRYRFRVNAYLFLLTDEYPAFSLD